jgi:hypothetical protein
MHRLRENMQAKTNNYRFPARDRLTAICFVIFGSREKINLMR